MPFYAKYQGFIVFLAVSGKRTVNKNSITNVEIKATIAPFEIQTSRRIPTITKLHEVIA